MGNLSLTTRAKLGGNGIRIMTKVNTEPERLISHMEKLGYTLTGKIEMVAWGFWEGDFQAPRAKAHPVRAQLHENQIIFLNRSAK